MIGGLWKSTSTAALFAAAGLFVGGVAMPSAKAADLGGDCCADLEERVAELEATTARKGNRRMSLTVSGQVTRSILYWNDGDRDGVYAGLDQHPQSSRFTFSGAAKISPNLTAGFELMTEWAGAGRTSSVDQRTPDQATTTTAVVAGADGALAIRTANWYLEDKTFGRVTVGRIDLRGPVATIDLGGISTVASASPSLVGGSFVVDGSGDFVGGTRLAALVGPSYGGDRGEGVRWDSASLAGFVLQATWAEDDVWTASIRYAGEFSGFRVAAGIGYLDQSSVALPAPNDPVQLDTGARNVDHEWSGSLAVMHVPSGLFVQGHYAQAEFFNGTDANIWLVQAGITKNWFGLGNTSLYGEYGEAQDYIKSGPANSALYPNPYVANIFAGGSSEVTFYGLGVVQQIDAAAMELYLGWRRYESDISGLAPPGDPTDIGFRNGSSELDLVTGGARIRF